MVTITLDRLTQQSLSEDLHFGDLSSFLSFLQDHDYVTSVGLVDDDALSDDTKAQIDNNLALDRSAFIDVTHA